MKITRDKMKRAAIRTKTSLKLERRLTLSNAKWPLRDLHSQQRKLDQSRFFVVNLSR